MFTALFSVIAALAMASGAANGLVPDVRLISEQSQRHPVSEQPPHLTYQRVHGGIGP